MIANWPAATGEIFVLPTALDFNLLQREALGRAIGEARRALPETPFSITTTLIQRIRWWCRLSRIKWLAPCHPKRDRSSKLD